MVAISYNILDTNEIVRQRRKKKKVKEKAFRELNHNKYIKIELLIFQYHVMLLQNISIKKLTTFELNHLCIDYELKSNIV